MTNISGFTFVHNAIESGYPIFEAIAAIENYVDEIVIVDMQSTDDTRGLLEKCLDNIESDYFNIHILDGQWGNQAGETLKQAHSLYKECSGDIILHFEADEVYDDRLLKDIVRLVNEHKPIIDIAVHRLQLEQNFQRCRWYPELVHRVFPRDSNTVKDGHTTNRHNNAYKMGSHYGFLWDITNCFRDNWLNRVMKQAELRNSEPNYLMAERHITQLIDTKNEALRQLNDSRWTWKATPFDIPDVLKPLVGVTKYEPRI